MTGGNVAETLITYATLASGKGFTAHFDLDHRPEIAQSPNAEEIVKQMAGEVIVQRMAAAKALVVKLVDLCYESGVLWIHPERGKAIQTKQELTPDEDAALKALQDELNRIDTFIHL